jgi:UDP-N-acetylbacillosamine N-acetyltransferase
MTEELVIWGASGHARVVADAVRSQGNLSIVGFIDDNPERKGEMFEGRQVLGGRDRLAVLLEEGTRSLHVAVGHCAARLEMSELAVAQGFHLKTVIHPRAIVASGVSVGDGTFLAAGVVVNVGCRIGKSVILNTSCSVDHECVISDGVHIGPGCHLGGGACVGRGAWIGIGASVSHRIQVGAGSIVGAGSVVVADIPAGVVAYGVPARVVRPRRPGE